LASSYDISSGTGRVQISTSNETFAAVQLSASGLDADITYKLQHSSDDSNYLDLASTSGTLTSASDSDLVQTFDFTLDSLYVYIDVGSATTGTVNILLSDKKKEDSSEVTATITGEVDANLTNTELDVVIDKDSEAINLLRNILKQQKLTNKLLTKILT
jgi:hypothetical protein